VSLKVFHVLFIVLSTLLALVFGLWCLQAPPQPEDTGGRSLMAILSFAVAAALSAYGVWFLRKVRTRQEERELRRKRIHPLPLAAAAALLASPEVLACSVCYGDAEGPMIDAARAGVWLLGGLVLSVQLVFGFFFYQMWRRSRGK
jgi:hypothetical protein